MSSETKAVLATTLPILILFGVVAFNGVTTAGADSDEIVRDQRFRILGKAKYGSDALTKQADALHMTLLCVDGNKVLNLQEEASDGESLGSATLRLDGSCDSKTTGLETQR